MDDSVLTSTKKILGIPDEHTAFDLDIITHLNSSFATLEQIGVIDPPGFYIEDLRKTWGVFPATDQSLRNMCKTYVFLCCKLLFDPPATSFHLTAMQEAKKEHEWRLHVKAEDLKAASA